MRRARIVSNDSAEAGAASSTTVQRASPSWAGPVRIARDTPSVPSSAACTPAAASARANTTVGSEAPEGKWAATVSSASTDSARTRNWSACASPTSAPNSPVAHTSKAPSVAAAIGSGLRTTAAAMRYQTPDPATSRPSTRGTNGQNTRRPHRASAGGSAISTNTAATTSPAAASRPRLRVLGRVASSRVSSASTTVTLLATIAGAQRRTAARRAAR
ncbi:Uncharacterised protein [Mycobacteroides abscessus subsp. abscessus]|nr:Uncharacterised protein [Mycobacteroides abscessus subsp. abscessus]